MKPAKHPGQRSSLFWGVWGICAALAVTVFDWYRTRHLDSPLEVAGRLVIFVAVGVFIGPFVSRKMRSRGDKKPTRAASIVRFALFAGLMLALACALWIMAGTR
jgi:drug/metabolite transporter (DMT)-like permease